MCNILNIPHYDKYNGEKRIALLDNSAVSFMLQLDNKGYKPDLMLQGYDVIFLPEWVVEEIRDSESRVQYIERLENTGVPIKIIKEYFYSNLMDKEEIFLYEIVKAAVSRLGDLKKYLRENVDKEDPLDMEPYEDWIREMYTNWPMEGGLTVSGRVKKKNAGEISLTILSEIFSWHYPDTEILTVYTQDSDSYVFQTCAEELLKKADHLKNVAPVSVTYRSNYSILCQMYRDKQLAIEEIGDIRKDARNVIYTLMREDNTVALVTKVLDNEEFVKLIQNKSVQIIF